MGRNCNLELRLVSSADSGDHHRNWNGEITRKNPENEEQQQQQLTIFYNGSLCVSDVTEIQARAILSMANQEIREEKLKMGTPAASAGVISSFRSGIPSQVYRPNTGLSMKRSLQKFLQKRKHRIQSTNPY